jgi:membrane protease YdiL (CAAX protease family)
MNAPAKTVGRGVGYVQAARSWTYAALLALPVMAAYEAACWGVNHLWGVPVRNGADVLLQRLLPDGWAVLLPAVMAAVLVGGALLEQRGQPEDRVPLRRDWALGMAAEALLYAALFGGVIGRFTAMVLPHSAVARLAAGEGVSGLSLPVQLVLSLGAGFYEEALFRGLLQNGLRQLFGLASGGWARDVAAVGLTAVVFSAFHYVGSMGESFELASFTFRMLSGVAFSALMATRGFGVCVLTHALYDVLVTLHLV